MKYIKIVVTHIRIDVRSPLLFGEPHNFYSNLHLRITISVIFTVVDPDVGVHCTHSLYLKENCDEFIS